MITAEVQQRSLQYAKYAKHAKFHSTEGKHFNTTWNRSASSETFQRI